MNTRWIWPRVKLSTLETTKPQLSPHTVDGQIWKGSMHNYRLLWCHCCRDEALTVIRNSLKGQVIDAWRRLCKEYELSNEQSNPRLLKRVLQPKQQSPENLRTERGNWEHEHRQCCSRTNDVLSDAVRRLALQSMTPQSLREPSGILFESSLNVSVGQGRN